jgi:hypothetical protein
VKLEISPRETAYIFREMKAIMLQAVWFAQASNVSVVPLIMLVLLAL